MKNFFSAEKQAKKVNECEKQFNEMARQAGEAKTKALEITIKDLSTGKVEEPIVMDAFIAAGHRKGDDDQLIAHYIYYNTSVVTLLAMDMQLAKLVGKLRKDITEIIYKNDQQ